MPRPDKSSWSTRRRSKKTTRLRYKMDAEAFRKHGKEMVDIVADMWDGVRERTPLPTVQPGYISQLVPSHPPSQPEEWQKIYADLEKVIFEGNTWWHHPNFHAYFPTACSYQGIMADILSGGISSIGFTWNSSPAMTELEMATLDWLVEILDLPQHFKNSAEGPGCGIIQSTASDATLIAVLTARARAVETVKNESSSILDWVRNSEVGKTVKSILTKVRQNTVEEADSDIIVPEYHDPAVFEKLVAYCSDQAHSSVEKGVMLCGVRLRKLKSSWEDEMGNYTVTKETLEAAIKEDRNRGLIPFVLVATMGTTCSCAFDRIDQLGPVCNRESIWLHVDAAYAGSFLICSEFRYLSKGMELVDSFNYNAHKAMMVNFDCSPMWFKDGKRAARYFSVDPLYLKHEHQAIASDYRHLQVALGRRFRSLKIWFVLRNLGVEFIQNLLKKQVELAKLFAKLVSEGDSFQLFVKESLGLVCMKVKNIPNGQDANLYNEKLCQAINEDRRIHIVPSTVHGTFFLRFSICSQFTTEDDVKFAYNVFEEVLKNMDRN